MPKFPQYPLSALVALGAVTTAASDQNASHRIDDPYEAEHFSCEGKPDGRLHNHPNESSGYSGFRIRTDLNFDGREDIILSMGRDPWDGDGGCASASCSANIFLKQRDDSYENVGLSLHPLAARSKRIGRGKGMLLAYYRSGRDSSWGAFEVGTSTVTLMNPPDARQSQSAGIDDEMLLADSRELHAEFSYCVAGKVQWRDNFR